MGTVSRAWTTGSDPERLRPGASPEGAPGRFGAERSFGSHTCPQAINCKNDEAGPRLPRTRKRPPEWGGDSELHVSVTTSARAG